MSQSSQQNYTQLLQDLMQQVGISSFKALSREAGVSERQVKHLRLGEVSQMRVETLFKISQVLQVSVSELLTIFGKMKGLGTGDWGLGTGNAPKVEEVLKQEYQVLLAQMEQQRETLLLEFQHSSLQILESFLVYWPTAANKAKENPQMAAVQLLPLVRPVEKLLAAWGVEAIASVGAELPYDQKLHQLIEGTAQPGEMVKVRNIGYRQGEKLLHRAKVSAISKA
ncbi:helix-turn-helix domain-containing protein [Funiculus sociatus GB2-A5]|uniref:Helix-turn-helix domain-containing protein n=1 Tax=Funiculus sociatus GB2-A5 TaxID=2933946 RepID=A0ABV0JWP7_9CYAN|nr:MULTISPECIES: helix-turn-helix domain-containing protein [unclassified Trichocoleus]MBD1904151.1 helix-turn-helix domain-containing protein [Trichocoleus sp. FACHB-832]MBD2063748.1 helix-turn-helix domain-containing protein [Trichocoleus sp. FACHB-6]